MEMTVRTWGTEWIVMKRVHHSKNVLRRAGDGRHLDLPLPVRRRHSFVVKRRLCEVRLSEPVKSLEPLGLMELYACAVSLDPVLDAGVKGVADESLPLLKCC